MSKKPGVRCDQSLRNKLLICSALIGLILSTNVAVAQEASASEVMQLRAELDRLKTEQLNAANRIDRLEQLINNIGNTSQKGSAPVQTIPKTAIGAVPEIQGRQDTKLQVSGDFRIRYEANLENDLMPFRGREVIRGRVGVAYDFNDWAKLAARITTGNADDPNSADVSLSSFVDDFPVSLDQMYAQFKFGEILASAGKFPNPFKKTDLVWDGDVNPQGVSVGYKYDGTSGFGWSANGIYFIIDENVAGPDSYMVGGQASLFASLGEAWRFNASAAFYDYTLKNLASAGPGDFRSNLRRADGRYVSDFNLVDLIGSVTYEGMGSRWPLTVRGDYVHNAGAATNADTGYSVDALLGRAKGVGDFRFGYGYSQAETDAVFAAFSHDNTNLPTNYRLHALNFDYVLAESVLFNVNLYHYRPLEKLPATLSMDWQNRMRFNLIYTF